MQPVVSIGGGGHAKAVLALIGKLPGYRVIGYTATEDRGPVLGAPYLGSDRELPRLAGAHPGLQAVLAVGQVGLGNARADLWESLRPLGLGFPVFVSPRAVLNAESACGDGTVVMDGVVVNPGAAVGLGVILNTNCTVEHDTVLGDWTHVAPGATLAGGVSVGRFSMIGAGATVIEGIKIAAGCLVGAGATVVDDLREPGVYLGTPARRRK